MRSTIGGMPFLILLILSLWAGGVAAADDEDCLPPTALLQRFMSADCAECWAASEPVPSGALALDWIAPAASGDAAPMAVAAVSEAGERARRFGTLTADRTLTSRQPLRADAPLALRIADGPAWSGYIGLQFEVQLRRRDPAGTATARGLQGWLALVERVPAGTDGSGSDRQLVRTLIGPLPLNGLTAAAPLLHLRATRLPENARPERLGAVGWIESASGELVVAGVAPYRGCGRRS